jgi:hypothetical protein
VPKHATRTRARAVSLGRAMRVHMAHEIFVLGADGFACWGGAGSHG